jgi:hypothetical protein
MVKYTISVVLDAHDAVSGGAFDPHSLLIYRPIVGWMEQAHTRRASHVRSRKKKGVGQILAIRLFIRGRREDEMGR